MNRNRIVVLFVALLAVGALAVAASTVDVPRDSESGHGSGSGSSISSGTAEAPQQPTPQQSPFAIPQWLFLAMTVLFAVGLLVVIVTAIYKFGLRNLGTAVGVFGLMLVAGMLVFYLIGPPEMGAPQQQPKEENKTAGGSGDAGREVDGEAKPSFAVPATLMGAFAVLMVILTGAIARFSGSEAQIPAPSDPDDASSSTNDGVKAVGEAAGRAADKLDEDSETVQNAIFQAWREMTDALDVDSPATTTPEEFADIAIDAGMAPDDVRELTWLFEEVRYGDAEVTDEREQRATDALRRIEDTYAEVSTSE